MFTVIVSTVKASSFILCNHHLLATIFLLLPLIIIIITNHNHHHHQNRHHPHPHPHHHYYRHYHSHYDHRRRYHYHHHHRDKPDLIKYSITAIFSSLFLVASINAVRPATIKMGWIYKNVGILMKTQVVVVAITTTIIILQ